MTRGSKKMAVKRAVYTEAMREQPAKPKASKARWVKHAWDEKSDSLKTFYWPAALPGAPGWHRVGSIGEMEQRGNAGQRVMF